MSNSSDRREVKLTLAIGLITVSLSIGASLLSAGLRAGASERQTMENTARIERIEERERRRDELLYGMDGKLDILIQRYTVLSHKVSGKKSVED